MVVRKMGMRATRGSRAKILTLECQVTFRCEWALDLLTSFPGFEPRQLYDSVAERIPLVGKGRVRRGLDEGLEEDAGKATLPSHQDRLSDQEDSPGIGSRRIGAHSSLLEAA